MGIENQVLQVIEKPILALGFTKVNVTYKKESGTFYLRVFIDKDDVISLDEIVQVNDLISPLLDEADLIQNEYILDVTSFGAEKQIDLDRLDKYVGKYVNIHLTHPYKGENYLEGTMESVSSSELVLSWMEKTRKVTATLERQYIDKARLAVKF